MQALAKACGRFGVSHVPPVESTDGETPADCWLELIANGLTFDITGLAPGAAAHASPVVYQYGLAPDFAVHAHESICVVPSPHLAGGATMTPIIRTLASLMAELSLLPGVMAVGWHPARCWSDPAQFHKAVNAWLDGGAFPVFSLAAIAPTPDGGIQSEGMSLFTGQELRVEPELAEDRARGGRVAIRVLHYLSERGAISEAETIVGPDACKLRLEPSVNQRFVRIWKA